MNHHSKTALIIPAAGSGERLGANLPKALVQVAGRTLIEHTIYRLAPIATQIIIAAPAGFEKEFVALFGELATVVTGGATRTQSVKRALAELSPEIEHVLVHDAARAFATLDLAERIVAELVGGELAVIPGIAISDTVKTVDEYGNVTNTPDRTRLRGIQTPQGFDRGVLEKAHSSGSDRTDDAGLVEETGVPVKVIAGEEVAFKVTTPADMKRAIELLLDTPTPDIRTGIGTDAHAFSADPARPMWLAGLHWPDVVGVDGHSDGDVAAHAICDALFSATDLGDLGSNFGTAAPEYAGASGEVLLKECFARITRAGFSIHNVAVQIVGNRPKIGPRRAEAAAALSKALNGAVVSLSATTTDGLGFTGEGKGISAIATALVVRR